MEQPRVSADDEQIEQMREALRPLVDAMNAVAKAAVEASAQLGAALAAAKTDYVLAPNDVETQAFACQPIPEHVTRVKDCNCGGSAEVHRTDCTIFDLPKDEYLANVQDAHERHDAYMADLNARLSP